MQALNTSMFASVYTLYIMKLQSTHITHASITDFDQVGHKITFNKLVQPKLI